MTTEKKTFFVANEEFEYEVKEVNGKFVGSTTFDPRLNSSGNSLEEVFDSAAEKLKQLTKAS